LRAAWRALTSPLRLSWRAARSAGRPLLRRLDREGLALLLFILLLLELGSGNVPRSAGDTLLALAGTATLPVALRRAVPVPAAVCAGIGVIGCFVVLRGVPVSAILALLLCLYDVGLQRPSGETRLIGVVGVAMPIVTALVAISPDLAGATSVSGGIMLVLALGANERRRRAAQADLAASVARTHEEQSRRTLLEERGRIARELHDVVAHHMSLIAVQAETAPYRLGALPAPVAADYATVTATARQGLTEMRRLLAVLRDDPPERVPQPGLADIAALVNRAATAGLAVTLALEGEPAPIDSGVALSAYRIVQESLTNVRRHAGPARAVVTVGRRPGAVTVRVSDDGKGVTADWTPAGGQGLLGMRERVAMFGGTLRVGPRQGGGFEVEAVLPA
jgi:signal transduction histidine kinase